MAEEIDPNLALFAKRAREAEAAEKAARRAEKARAKVETHAAIVTAAHTGTAVETTPV